MTDLIPFDLERAKKGVPMRTRDDRKAIFVTILNGGQPAPLVVEVWYNHDDEWDDDDDNDDDIDDYMTAAVAEEDFDDDAEGNEVSESDEGPIGILENYYIDGRHGTVHDSDLDLFMEY